AGEAAVAAVRDQHGDADAVRPALRIVEPLVDLLGGGVGIERRAHAQPFVPVGAGHGSDMHRGSFHVEALLSPLERFQYPRERDAATRARPAHRGDNARLRVGSSYTAVTDMSTTRSNPILAY